MTQQMAVRVRGTVGGTNDLTRPANTDAYVAEDAISDSTTAPSPVVFSGVGRTPGGSGYITKAIMQTSQTTFTGRLRLHLFNAAPTAINDNAAASIPDLDHRGTYLGKIDFPAGNLEGSADSAYAEVDDIVKSFVCAAGQKDIWGLVETLDAFTPASAQTFSFVLEATQN